MTTPAVAVAASLCWLARTRSYAVSERHPAPCDWCDWPLDDLLRMAADVADEDRRRFSRLSRDEQRRLVDEAQGGLLVP